MANNTKFNLDKINQMLTPKSTIKRYSEFVKNSREGINDAFSYAQKMGAKVADGVSGTIDDVARRFGKNTGAASGSSVGQYQSRLSGGRVAPASSVTGEPSPSAIPTANEEVIATAKSYNTASATEPGVSSPASEESVSEGRSYNGGYKTDALEAGSYTELLNEQQQFIDKSKSEADKEADDQLNIDMRDAQANYQQNNPRYGATAENLLEQGLGDSGFGEYLAGKREEQLTDERMAARSRHSYARLAADKAHDAATLDLNAIRGQYAKELDAEYKAIYSTVLKEVNSGIYDAQIGAKILEQYAGGALDQDTLSALSAAELSATRSGQSSTIGAITEYLNGFEIPPTVDMMKDYLDGLNLTVTQKNNILAAMYDENGKFVGKFGTTNPSDKPLTGVYPNDGTGGDNTGDNTGTTIPDGFTYITEAELIKQFKEAVGREPTADELASAKARLTAHSDGYLFKNGATIGDLFDVSESYSADTIKKYLEQVYGSVSDEQLNQVLAMCTKLSDGTYILPDTEDYKNIFKGNTGNSGNSTTMTPTEQAVKELLEKGSTTVTDAFVNETMSGLVISSALYNTDGSAIVTNKEGDDFSIKMGDKKYRVQHGGRATELQGVNLDGIKEGAVFGYNGKLYVMTDKGAFRIEERDVFFKKHYNELLSAVYGEAFQSKGEDGKYVQALRDSEVDVKEKTWWRLLYGDDGDVALDKTFEENDAVIISDATYNSDGSKIRALVEGDDFRVKIGDKSYAVQNAGVAELSSDVTNKVKAGNVFVYKNELYLKGDKRTYKLESRDMFNRKSYQELKDAIFNSANKNVGSLADGVLDFSGGASFENMGEYEEGVVNSGYARGYAHISSISDSVKENGYGWIKVNTNGSQFKVKLNGEADGIDAQNANDGEVFLYDDEAYAKINGKVYNVDKRWLGGSSYKNMLKAIEGNKGDYSKYTDAAVSLPGTLSDTSKDKIGLMHNDEYYEFAVHARFGKDTDVFKAAKAAGIEDKSIFAHHEDMYLMLGEQCIKLGAVSGRKNGDYDKYKAAISKGGEYPFENFRNDSGASDSVESGSATEEGDGNSGGNAGGVTPEVVPDGTVTPPSHIQGTEWTDEDTEYLETTVSEIQRLSKSGGITWPTPDEKTNRQNIQENSGFRFKLNGEDYGATVTDILSYSDINKENLTDFEKIIVRALRAEKINMDSDIDCVPFFADDGTLYMIYSRDASSSYLLKLKRNSELEEYWKNSEFEVNKEIPTNGGSEGGAENKESGWDKVVAWWKNLWADKEPEYTDEDRDVTRGLATFETDGRLFGIDRNLKSGDNITVEIDGQSYAVESRGEVKSEKATHLYADAADVANGEVFLYGDGMFLKKDGKIYSVDARKLFGKGQADKLKEAIKANSAEGEGGSTSVYSATSAGDAKGSLSADNFKSGEYEAFDKISFINKVGESYKLQVRAVLGSDSSAHKAAVSSGISDGQLFRHGQDFYVKDGETVLKMSATSGKSNSDYDALVNLDEDAIDETLNRRVCGAVKKSNSSVDIYIGSNNYSAKLENNVSKNAVVVNAAEGVESGEVFAIGKRLYFKENESKLWLIEKDEDLYNSFMSGKTHGEYDTKKTDVIIPSKVTTLSYNVHLNGTGINGSITDKNNFDVGEQLTIPLDENASTGERYTAKCLYKTTGNAYKAAKAAGLAEHQIYFWADELYVFCDGFALRLGGGGYDKLKKKLEEQQSSVATVGDTKGLYSQHLT